MLVSVFRRLCEGKPSLEFSKLIDLAAKQEERCAETMNQAAESYFKSFLKNLEKALSTLLFLRKRVVARMELL